MKEVMEHKALMLDQIARGSLQVMTERRVTEWRL
jgi:hypothetical protein